VDPSVFAVKRRGVQPNSLERPRWWRGREPAQPRHATFISLVLLTNGISHPLIGPILLICGACGLVGLRYSGRHVDRSPRRTVVAIFAVLILAILALGGTWSVGVAAVAAAAVWNGHSGPFRSIFQACAVRTHALSPELAGAWINALAHSLP
jgi:predicted MFS family arabinose efflux permease